MQSVVQRVALLLQGVDLSSEPIDLFDELLVLAFDGGNFRTNTGLLALATALLIRKQRVGEQRRARTFVGELAGQGDETALKFGAHFDLAIDRVCQVCRAYSRFEFGL